MAKKSAMTKPNDTAVDIGGETVLESRAFQFDAFALGSDVLALYAKDP